MNDYLKFFLAAVAALAAGYGAYHVTSVSPDASSPTAHTAPADAETGDIIRDKLDPRQEK